MDMELFGFDLSRGEGQHWSGDFGPRLFFLNLEITYGHENCKMTAATLTFACNPYGSLRYNYY